MIHTPFQELPDLLTAEQIGTYLRVSRSSVARFKKRGTLVPSQTGERDLYSKESLKQFLESNQE